MVIQGHAGRGVVMKIAFRADASLEMGTGHVMRCLTLADALTARGAECNFICREHPGHLGAAIQARGYPLELLPMGEAAQSDDPNEVLLQHANWLGSDWCSDAEQSRQYLQELQPDWLIVDHYGLDQRWERELRGISRQLMVIDDLADRVHDCELLLDQTFGREANAYHKLVPNHCKLLVGSKYALLRPEFAALREYSLEHRKSADLKHLLITMGGVDKDNVTGRVLEALRACPLPEYCVITIVMGATAPWMEIVQLQAQTLPWQVMVRVNVSDMAQLMADADLAIGAAGSTSWERCTLGLPTLMMVLADNQKTIASKLEATGAVQIIESHIIVSRLPEALHLWFDGLEVYQSAVKACLDVCDGQGTVRVCKEFLII